MMNNSNILVDEKVAVSLFLESLLRETEIETELTLVPEIAEPENVTQLKLAPTIETQVELKAELEIKNDVVVHTEVEKPAVTTDIPQWANKPFKVLFFYVAGIKLAVPLIELCGVVKRTSSVTQMPGHADFYMGILRHLKRNIAVIDAAKMVLPDNKQAQLIGDKPRERVKHIVLIGDYSWGLACDKIGEVITLQPDDIRWKKSNTGQIWLSGTVVKHMCALLNSEGFTSILKQND